MTDLDRVLYATVDPTSLVDGRPLPALTVLLYRVCQNDHERFWEATRLIGLFIQQAIGDGHD